MHQASLLLGILVITLLCSCSTPAHSIEPPLASEEREQRLIDARFNMIHMCQAFSAYNLQHDTPPPTQSWQQALIEAELWTPDKFVSPATDGDSVEYVMIPASEISFDRQQVLVYEDPDHHLDEVVVMFHDLHAESIPRERFAELASEQGFTIISE